MKPGSRMAAWLAGTVLLMTGAVVAINATDETLDAAAAGFGEPRPARIAAADNGYLRMIALDAPAGSDASAWALAWLAESRAAAAEKRAERRADVAGVPPPSTCDATERSCLERAAAAPGELDAAVAAQAELLVRYEDLLGAPGFEEVLDYPLRVDSGFPPVLPFVAAQKAWLARAALAAQGGDIEAALGALERDLALQRRVVSGARTLLVRTVATANYWRDLAFIADLAERQGEALAPHVPRLRALLADPGFLVANQGALVETEFAWGKALLRDPLAAPIDATSSGPGLAERALFGLLYRPHATLNREVGRLRKVAAALELPPPEGSAALAEIGREYGAPRAIDHLVNPAGTLLLLLPLAVPAEDAYQRLRMYDTLGFARLVALCLDAAQAGPGAEPPDLPAAAGAAGRDPYTGQPFAWDPAARELAFAARSRALQTRELANARAGRVFVRL